MLQRSTASFSLSLWFLSSALLHAAAPPNTPEFFETKVRPILAVNCLPCHTNSQLGGLRLDSRDAVLKGGKSGPSVVPGSPEKSPLILGILQTGELKMPKGGKLSKEDIDDLTTWVKAGAVWGASAPVQTAAAKGKYVITPEQRAFWSLQPLKPPTVPAVKTPEWAKTQIDRFVLAKLEKNGLTPVRAADRRSLIRRASFDLIGLPPSPEETEAFEKDQSPEAFAKVVDRLLSSPHYGERWGRVWLDVARYGEDDYRSLDPMRRGYNPYPNAYLYRDWVFQSFNNDLPFDQFVKAQLAADQLDEKSRSHMLPALGFLGQGPWYYDNGAVEVTHADERHDRVDVVTRGFLGLTVACARCHDHKYDPIPTKDYYSLAGVFANTHYTEYPRMPKELVADYDEKEKKIESRSKLLGEIQQNESSHLAETLAIQISKYMQAAWRVTGEPKDKLDRVVNDEKLDYELLDHYVRFLAKPPKFYPYLEKWQAMVKQGGTPAKAKKMADEFQALVLQIMFEKRELKEENEVIAAKALPGTKPKEYKNKPSDFVTNEDFCPGCSLELKTIPLERMNLWTDIFRRDMNPEVDEMGDPRKLLPGLLVFRGWGLERQLSAERLAYLDMLRKDIETAKKALPAKYPFVHGVVDADKPVDLKVSLRGSPYNLGDVEPRHFLSILTDGRPEPFIKGSGRIELAENIVRQPIAMRVYVNRIWKSHFGSGIVDTPSNFGFAGERPVNPELLEFLAQSFVENGMSTKKLHREIMLSAVYQLSTDNNEANFAKDSGNRFYWRYNRHRMDAEQIRDSLLMVSGNIDLKLYGPSSELTPDFKRRTAYGKVSRYKLDEYLSLFDFPSPAISAEKRFSTNVPLQRLFFMNSDFVQQQGELLARRVADAPDTAAKVQKSYRILFNRDATQAELQAGLEYLRAEPLREYEERKQAALEKKAKAKKADKEHSDKPEALKADDEEETADAAAPAKSADDATAADMGDGMMAGMKPSRPGAKSGDSAKAALPTTVWGRYEKILLSSTEFTFIN